jgi:hypothetical protein
MQRRKARAVLVMAAVLALAACSMAPDDATITNEIKAKMFSDAELRNASLNVTVKNGEATLAGEVASEAARYQAFKLASEAKGVTKVHDQMRVAGAAEPAPALQPVAVAAPAPAPKRVKRAAPSRPAPSPEEAAPAPAPAPVQTAPVAARVEEMQEPKPAPAREPEPVAVEIRAGTRLTVRMIDAIDSEVHRTGETFQASLDAPIVLDNEVVVPASNDVTVRLVEAKSAGRMTGRSELRLELVALKFQGKTYQLQTGFYEQKGKSSGQQTAKQVGAGAAIGAVIGAIAGGGKGAAIGAGVGAGAGTAVGAMTKGQQIRVPPETRLEFTLEAPVSVTYFPEKNKTQRR